MKIIRLSFTCVYLLLLCSCATTPRPAAIVPAPELPAAVTMNRGAGRGGHLIVTLRLEGGKRLPVVVDTGSPLTFLDKSVEPQLGKRLGTGTFWNFGVKHEANFYAAPKLYFGNTRLMIGSFIGAMDIKQQFSATNRPIMGILGMDCLKHYCIQLDFQAERVRFLNPVHLNTTGLGKAFPLIFSRKGQSERGLVRPLTRQGGLIGKRGQVLMVDTGYENDGALASAQFRREVRDQRLRAKQSRVEVHPYGDAEWFPNCVWNGGTYTNLLIGNGGPNLLHGNGANLIGLRFLARHLVTFDFPIRTMYLKQTSIGPLAGDKFVEAETYAMAAAETAEMFLHSMKEKGQLPDWSKQDHGTLHMNFDFHGPGAYPESEIFDARKNGDSSIYYYKLTRGSKSRTWELGKAWRTDQNGHTVEEYPVP